ncbi:MAG: hypothetical protein K6E38_02650, partial [Fretibacterium sp.]|nr:hypothetical protein [Fretibacterium sp.]
PMAATVAWRADDNALQVAKGSVRPAVAFVWLDAALKVSDRNGNALADHVSDYVNATSAGMIPAFCVRDAAAAAALKTWLSGGGLKDCFVVSTPENKAAVRDVADLLHVRGMLDYTANRKPDRTALLDMVSSVNGAHGKVVLLSREAATRENIRLLQSLCATVWVQAPADTKTLVTLYTDGVNGVVTEDYEAAIRAEELFRDDAPSLLRLPFIIGHRGDPSQYVENTLDSARGAFEEGADSVENDIHLSSDGELFIFHDDTPERFLCLRDVEDIESMTLAELRTHPFVWSNDAGCILQNNEVRVEDSRYGKFYGQDEQKQYTVPTLREYIETFRGKALIHATEIKSCRPEIIPVYKALVDQYDVWDQFFTITFNREILEAVYKNYPEISIGALMIPLFDDYDGITEEQGAEAALEKLYESLDQWNATYNPMYFGCGEAMIRAGRHRGLTVWLWTYGQPQDFARDYVKGFSGLTLDFPWWASDDIVEISLTDTASGTEVPQPEGRTRTGVRKTLEGAEQILLEERTDSSKLMIWRYRADLNVNGTSFGSYYLYSNPFIVEEEKQDQDPGGDESGVPVSSRDSHSGCELGLSVLAFPALSLLIRKRKK